MELACLAKSNPFIAKCPVCRTSFQLSNMGNQAVKSHAKGEKHKQNTKSNLKIYFKPKTTEKSTSKSFPKKYSVKSKQKSNSK